MTATTVILTNSDSVSTVDLDTPCIYIVPRKLFSNSQPGAWINTTLLPQQIQAQISSFFRNIPPSLDHFAIEDSKNFYGFDISKFQDLDCINALSASFDEHKMAFALYINYVGVDIDSPYSVDDVITNFEDHYQGCFESIEDYAEHYYESTGLLSSIEAAGLPYHYIDWSAIATDWDCSGDYFFLQEAYQQLHVFTNH